MEKTLKDKVRSNKTAKFIYLVFVLGLIGLLFVPSLFTTGASLGFKGGETLFNALKALFGDLVSKSSKFADFAPFAAIKWAFYLFAGIIVANLVIFIIALFVKRAVAVRRIFIITLTVTLAAFSVFAVMVLLKLNTELYLAYKTVLAFYIALTFIVSLLISFTAFKSTLKSVYYILSLAAVVGLLYKTLAGVSGGNTGYFFMRSMYEINKISGGFKLYLDSLAQMPGMNAFFAGVAVYGLLAVCALTLLNLVISSLGLNCNKTRLVDVIRFPLSLLVSGAVLAVYVIKLDANLLKSYGLLAIVVINLVLTVLAIIGYARAKKGACVCSDEIKNKKQKNFEPSLVGEQSPMFETKPQETSESSANINLSEPHNYYNQQPQTDYAKQNIFSDAAEEVFDIPVEEPVAETYIAPPEIEYNQVYDVPAEPAEEEVVQLEIEKLPEGAKAAPVDKTVKDDTAALKQVDIESLKKEILAELYNKERTATMTEDKPAVRYDVKQPTENKTAVGFSVNPYMKPRAEAPSDRFFDSLTDEEKREFEEIFIKRVYGDNKRLPVYVIGGDNSEFFARVFIFIGRYRSIISESLLSKMYLYSVAL